MQELFYICSAFGLAGAAGLRVYLPLLAMSVLTRFHVMTLKAPYDILGEWWVIALLVVLCVIEFVADKWPVIENLLHGAHLFIAPVAGAILFAAQAGHLDSLHPSVWLILGFICTAGVQSAKTVTRAGVSVGTAGHGGWLASFVEDALAVMMTVLAFVAPILAVLLLAALLFVMWKVLRSLGRFFFKKKTDKGPVDVVATSVAVPDKVSA